MIETIVHNKAQKSWTPLFSNIMIALDLATGTVSLSLEMEYGSGSKFIVSRGARRATVKAIRTITGGKFKEGRKEGRESRYREYVCNSSHYPHTSYSDQLP